MNRERLKAAVTKYYASIQVEGPRITTIITECHQDIWLFSISTRTFRGKMCMQKAGNPHSITGQMKKKNTF
jgi:hypothetical protein